MKVSDVKKLKDLEDENARLKRMVANLSLENDVMKDVSQKKVLMPAEKRDYN